jgi:hypothetical protein
MKAIGRMLACALLAVALVKNVLATSAANIEFSKGRVNQIQNLSNVTKLTSNVSEQLLSNPDNEDSRAISKNKRGGEQGEMWFCYTYSFKSRTAICNEKLDEYSNANLFAETCAIVQSQR